MKPTMVALRITIVIVILLGMITIYQSLQIRILNASVDTLFDTQEKCFNAVISLGKSQMEDLVYDEERYRKMVELLEQNK